MLNKKVSFCIICGLIIGILNVIVVFIYENLVSTFFKENYYEDLRRFYRIKYIYGDSINNLQLIIFSFDVFYALIFFLIQNKAVLDYFSLNFDSVATQSSSNLPNFFLELFFSILLKVKEIKKIISIISLKVLGTTLDKSSETKEILIKLDTSFYLLLCFTILNFILLVLFIVIYLFKFISLYEIEKEKPSEQLIQSEITSTDSKLSYSTNSFLTYNTKKSSKHEQLIN